MKDLGLYIHIPFCENKCSYCNFISFCASKDRKNDYINSLINEIESQKEFYSNYEVSTIFIGGGTPSCLENGQITKILNSLYENFNIKSNAEITVEANPNSITKDFINELENCKVNRISIGLQTSNNVLLKQINRIHSLKDFENSIKLIKNSKINNINVDLLIGLPNQTMLDVKNSLDLLLNYDISHISCYGLILEENTPLFKAVKTNKLTLPTEEECNEMYNFVLNYLKKHDIFRYEVSNFCKKGYECKHNLKYWNREDYLGLGLVSSSLINGERFNNEENLDKYIAYFVKKNTPQKQNLEILSINDEIEETIMLSLRKQEGLNLTNFEQRFKINLLKSKNNEIKKLIKLKLVKLNGNYLQLTDEGFYLLNQVILELI